MCSRLYLRSFLRFESWTTTHARSFLLAGMALPIVATPAVAQGVSELPEIVVEGATLEAPPAKPKKTTSGGPAASQAPSAAAASTGDGEAQASAGIENGVPASEIGSAVSVVTGAQLRAQQIRHAADALQSLPGVSVNRQGTFNNLTVVRIRGAESNHSLVLIDGVEVNSASTDGFFDFSNLGADEIEQIEVIRGPQGGLYGTGAIGGVVNIITKSGKGPLTVSGRGEAGAFGARDGALQISGGDDDLYGSVTVQGRTTDGFNISPVGDEHDGGRLSTFAFRGGVALLDNLILDGTLRFSKNDGDRDGFDGNLNGLSVPSDEPSVFTNRLWVGRLQATLDTFDGNWTHKLHLSGTETDAQDTTINTAGSTFTHSVGDATKFGYTSTYRLETTGLPGVRHYFTGLVERERQRFEQPTDPSAVDRERHTTSFAGEVRGEYLDTLFLTGNIRHDDNDFVEDFTTWRTTGSLKLPQTPFRLHASAGTGVKYPSLSEQYGTFASFLPNPDLTPEEAFGWDAGVETTLLPGRAILDVTYFDTELTNEIDFQGVFVGPDFFFQPFNREGTSTRRGIELAGRYFVGGGLTLGAAYTYLDSKDDSGNEEIRRAPHTGRFDIEYSFDGGRGNLNAAAIYNGNMLDNAFDAGPPFDSYSVVLDEYWLVNVAASYELSPGLELYGRIENLLDENYQQVFGYETAGIAAYAGMRFSVSEQVTPSRLTGN
jgi:vitamin B12 transporter